MATTLKDLEAAAHVEEDEDCDTWEKPKEDVGLLHDHKSNGKISKTMSDSNSDVDVEKNEKKAASGEVVEKRSLVVSILILIFSVPALVGSWCWPVLLASFLGFVVSDAAETFAHSLSFGVTFAAITNVAQYIWWKCKPRKGTHFEKYGPFYISLAAVFFLIWDPLHHVFLDGGIAFPPTAIPQGVYMTSDYIGFALLMTGAIWSANVVPKIIDAYRKIRQQSALKKGVVQ